MRILFASWTFALAALTLPVGAEAQQSGSTYDWQSGNMYTWSRQFDGSTHVRGLNSRTGTNWSTTIQPNGNMRGFDGGGNFWNYNDATGLYQNFGMGTTCVGKGAGRTCF
jgi:hypothetical protein